MTFGEKLQKLRKEAGMSQEELAARLNVSRQAVSKWERDSGYQYEMTGIVYPPNADKNILIDFGIVETDE